MKIVASCLFVFLSLALAANISGTPAQVHETSEPKKFSLINVFKNLTSKIKSSVAPKAKPVKSITISSNYDVRQHSVITSGRLDMFLGGVLKNKGSLFIEVARKNNICPITFAAIAMHESANGNSKFARERNNVFGIYLKGKYHYFDSVEECIEYSGKLLGGKLYCGGRNYTIKKIQQIYCPVGANNDPRGINKYWLSGVLNKMKTLWGEEIFVVIDA